MNLLRLLHALGEPDCKALVIGLIESLIVSPVIGASIQSPRFKRLAPGYARLAQRTTAPFPPFHGLPPGGSAGLPPAVNHTVHLLT